MNNKKRPKKLKKVVKSPSHALFEASKRNSSEPATPNTKLFHRDHATFVVPSHNVLKTWESVRNRVKKSRSRALSINAVDQSILKFGQIINELVQGKQNVDAKDEDLRLAAEIGQTLLEKNTHVESVCVDLKTEQDALLSKISRLQKQCESYKQHCEDLTATNLKLVKLADTFEKDDKEVDFDKFSLPDFLRSELDIGDVQYEYVGEINKDMTSFRRKLRRERKQAQLANGLYEESLATLREEKDELRLQVEQMKSSQLERDALEARNSQLRDEITKLHDKMRDQNLQHLSILNRRKTHEDDLAAREAKLQDQHRRERDELEVQLSRARERIQILENENERLKEARAAGSDAEMRQLTEENKSLNQRIKELMSEIENQRHEISDLDKKLSAFREVALNLRGESERERQLAADAEKKVEQYQQISKDLEGKIDVLSQQVTEVELQRNNNKADSELDKRLQALKKEKTDLEVKLRINQKQEQSRTEELRRREEELALLKGRMLEYERERNELQEQFKSVEIVEQLKFQEHNDALNRITEQLRVLMREYAKKKIESEILKKQLDELRQATKDLEALQAAKVRYKEMGKKMLSAMKQMDKEMKELIAKLKSTENELKNVNKERRRLERKNEELTHELDLAEKQTRKLMRLCIRGGT